MSRQPEPPASIAAAVAEVLVSSFDWSQLPDALARAVWDALLAEGRLDHERDSWDSTHDVLVIPLPVVEPRDTEHA